MKARKVKGLEPQAPLRDNADKIVLTRLDEVMSIAEQALAPAADAAQHDLRIAAKRLRYVLEVTAPCVGPAGEAARKEARALQDVLGEIHDCDVMLPRVENLLESLRVEDVEAAREQGRGGEDLDPAAVRKVPNRDAYPGLELLVVHLRARRAVLFERFCELWRSQVKKGIWDDLSHALGPR